jgi:hypothetical protein
MIATPITAATVAQPAASAPGVELRRTADELVGSVFYGTLLRQLRQSSLKGAYGHGGRGEEVFGAQLDQVLAQRAGRARTNPLSAAVARWYGNQAEVMDRVRQQQRQTLAASVESANPRPTPVAEKK